MLKSYFDWELEFREKKSLPGENKKLNSLGIPESEFKKIMEKYRKEWD